MVSQIFRKRILMTFDHVRATFLFLNQKIAEHHIATFGINVFARNLTVLS